MNTPPRSFPVRFLVVWFASAFATVVLPLVLFGSARVANSYNQYNGNNNNNNYNNNNYNNQNGQNGGSPWWYWGGHQGQNAREEENAPPVLVAAYLWSIIVFAGVVFFGYREMQGRGDITSVIVALVMFSCYSFISMLVFGAVDGAVEAEGRVVEEHGFMGQFGVMVRFFRNTCRVRRLTNDRSIELQMYITSMFWLVFSILFSFLLRRQARHQAVTKVEVDSSDYRIQNETV